MNQPTLPYKIFDEIALEGLEGITLPTLWLYLSESMKLAELPDSLKSEIWQFIKQNTSELQFFELPTERTTWPIFKRFEVLDEDYGVPVNKDDIQQRRYKFAPIQEKNIMGSCEYYKERVQISSKKIKNMSLEDLNKSYGEKFVIVASQDRRYNALFPSSVLICRDMPLQLYCIFEIIGRSRFSGETTSGPSSLQDFVKDATLVFYLKNKLLKMGVIVTQNYNELRRGRLFLTTLIRLPRFYTAHQSALNFVIETVFYAFEGNPHSSLPLTELRTLFPAERKITSLKKIANTHNFRRVFDVKSVPFKNANKSKSSTEENKGRTMLLVSLRDPKMSSADLFTEINNSDEREDSTEVNTSSINKLAYVDMTLKEQVYNAILRHGPRGLSQSEICCYLGLANLVTRQIVKHFIEKRLVAVYTRDVGRQRVQMYVASEFEANVSDFNASMEEIRKLKCNDEPTLPSTSQQKLSEVPEITATVEHFRHIMKQTRDMSNRQIGRTEIVINALNDKCLIHIFDVLNLIASKEKEKGYTDMACRKSIRRILNHLAENCTINMYEVILKLQKEGNTRIHRFITHPKIHIDHEVVKNEILSLKTAFYIRIEEQRLSQESQRQAAELKLQKKEKEKGKEANKKILEEQKIEQKRGVFQKIPKFLVSRYMHEFLYYVVMELRECETPQEITEDLLQHWRKTEPSILVKEYMELLQHEDSSARAYAYDISWRTFIPPLQKYEDKPTGWVFLLDAVERMPLSIFMKIFRLENNLHTSLQNYLSHPIRQHYLVNQLPVELYTLINRVYMQKVFLTVLKLLNHMGLVQVSDKINKQDKLMMWVYLNRNSIIMDTTTSEASYSTINPSRQYESTRYVFNTFDDVYRYWMNLQRICVYTKLGFRKDVDRTKQRKRAGELTYIEHVGFDEAPSKDIGYVPGDGLGAGGLASKLYAHNFRNWSWAVTSHSKNKLGSLYVNRRISKLTESKNKTLMLKKSFEKKQNIPVSLIKRLVPCQSGSKPTSSSAGSSTKRTKRTNFRDAIDREALKNMRTLRVTWSAEEDKIIKMARATYMFLTPPVVSLPLVTVSKVCRDVIRHTIGIRNKTIQACLRRFHFLTKSNRHLPETPLWVNMLQNNEQMIEKYGNDFILNLKQIYPDRSEFSNALAMHFIEVMCFLFKQVNNIDEAIGVRFCIPDNIKDFKQFFIVRLHAKNIEKPIQHENPQTDFDLKVSVIYGVLHSSMCCVRDKTLFTLQAFEILKHFSEEELKTAYTKARSDGLAVAIKRKHMNPHLPSPHQPGPSYLLSSKYRFKLTTLKIPYQTYEAVHAAFGLVLESLYGCKESQCYELKATHIGYFLVLCEGLAENFWGSSVEYPANILTVDFEQPISSTDRILNHYHGIFDNAPKIEYIKNFSNESTEKRARVKFHSANLSYKINYSPYDLISKLPARHLHFFCALGSLQQNVDINFGKLQRQESDTVFECPFNCIMKNENYLETIQSIVFDKKDIIEDLQDTTSQKLLNQVASSNTIKIQASNVLPIVRMLEKAWREREELFERKDLGKKLLESKNKTINWPKLCQDILELDTEEDDVDKNDEFEPLLTKDDRMRDAFVINLPTIKIEPSQLLNSDEHKVLYNDLYVSQSLLPTESLREKILEKVKRDSIWMYTEENLEAFKSKLQVLQLSSMEQKHIEEIYNFVGTMKFGVSFKELLREFPYEDFLKRALQFLSDNFFVKRVGVAAFVYVHRKYMREWLVHTFHITRRDQENLKAKKRPREAEKPHCPNKKLKRNTEQQEKETKEEGDVEVVRVLNKEEPKERDVIVLRPRPWIRLNGSLNRRVLDRWMGSVLAECAARHGCFILDLCNHFQNMFPADIYFLLEILCDLKCIRLKQIRNEEVDAFSEYKDIEEVYTDEIIDPDCTYVTLLKDAFMRMTCFIGDKKYNAEFV